MACLTTIEWHPLVKPVLECNLNQILFQKLLRNNQMLYNPLNLQTYIPTKITEDWPHLTFLRAKTVFTVIHIHLDMEQIILKVSELSVSYFDLWTIIVLLIISNDVVPFLL